MRKEVCYFIIILILMFSVTAIVNKSFKWHSGNNILLNLNGFQLTLQQAIGNNFLGGCDEDVPHKNYPVEVGPVWHKADEILISVDGVEKTLQEAAYDKQLCGHLFKEYASKDIPQRHFSNEIEILIDGSAMSLQDAINAGKFCKKSHVSSTCIGNDIVWYNSCGEEEERITCATASTAGTNYCGGADSYGFEDIYQDTTTGTCLNSECVTTIIPKKIKECGSNGCSNGQCKYVWRLASWKYVGSSMDCSLPVCWDVQYHPCTTLDTTTTCMEKADCSYKAVYTMRCSSEIFYAYSRFA